MRSFDFNRPIRENKNNKPFLVAHRGIPGGNIPCNSLGAFKVALNMGADVIEFDVAKFGGEYCAFHPGSRAVSVTDESISILQCEDGKLGDFRYLNNDGKITSYKVPTLQEVFALLKDKVYINVDKYWENIADITDEIRRAGVEKQVIVKVPCEERYFDEVERCAPDLMLMVKVKRKDDVSEKLLNRNLNYIGAEVGFLDDSDDVCSDEYIKWMHEHDLMIWGNPLIYDEAKVHSGSHTDDVAMTESKDAGWKFFLDKGFDFVQSDWLSEFRRYMDEV